jgi:hypothetical protein
MFALIFSPLPGSVRAELSFSFDFSAIDPWLKFKEFELLETQTLAAWLVFLDQIQPAKVPQDPVFFLEPCHLFFKLLIVL